MQQGVVSMRTNPDWNVFAGRSPIGIAVTTGPEHRLDYANAAFASIVGAPESDLVAIPLDSVLHSEHLTRLLDHVLESGEPVHGMPLHTRQRELLVNAWLRAEDEVSGLVLEIGDAPAGAGSERAEAGNATIREANARLLHAALREEELAEQARAASQAKSDFLALVSHELRTPLAAVIGYTDLLQSSAGLGGRSAEWVDRILVSAHHLRRIVDDLIGAVVEGHGVERLHSEVVAAGKLARDAIGLVEPAAGEKALELRLRGDASAPDLFIDARKVRQVLSNVLSNAIKFTENGWVELEVQEADDSVRYVIRDTGIGIARDDLERIFEPFVQVDSTSTRRHGGCGLGLGLGRRYARALGGDLTVSSDLGRGSTFVLSLPITAPETQPLVKG